MKNRNEEVRSSAGKDEKVRGPAGENEEARGTTEFENFSGNS
jgi:hypothetical protein